VDIGCSHAVLAQLLHNGGKSPRPDDSFHAEELDCRKRAQVAGNALQLLVSGSLKSAIFLCTQTDAQTVEIVVPSQLANMPALVTTTLRRDTHVLCDGEEAKRLQAR
jgi:hypothetical protein